jgi:hypothetical protein
VVRTADAAAQLVQLRQAELVGAVDDDGVGVGDVDARLDDGRAHQHVEALLVEVEHHLLQLALGHLAVGDADARLGHQLLQFALHALDALDLVVQEVDLAAARELALEGLAQQRAVPLARRRSAPPGGAPAAVAMIDRSRRPAIAMLSVRGIGRGGEREQVHLGAQRLQRLLLAHAEALFLVDDDQAQVLELHVVLQQAVGADDDVDLPSASFSSSALISLALEARQHLDPDRPVGEAVAEVAVVLLGQQGGRHQHRDLLAGAGGDEGGAHRDLGLAEADVAADHAVHRLAAAEVAITASMARAGRAFPRTGSRGERFVHRPVDAARGRRAPGAGPGSPAARRRRRGPSRPPCAWPWSTARRPASAAARSPARRRNSG